MAISPQLLAQWAQPRTQPVDTFMTAYQTGQNNRLQKEALSMKREEALRQRQMDWNKMVIDARQLQLSESEEARKKAEFEQGQSALASAKDTYRMPDGSFSQLPKGSPTPEGGLLIEGGLKAGDFEDNTKAASPFIVVDKDGNEIAIDKNAPDAMEQIQSVLANGGSTKVGGGIVMRNDPDTGEFYFSIGGKPGELGKKAEGSVDTKLQDIEDAMARYDEISSSVLSALDAFGPGSTVRDIFSQPAKFNTWLQGMRDKWGVAPLSAQEEAELAAVSTVFTKVLDNMNQTLKMLSGAAVSDQEFKRVSATLANLGTLTLSDIISGKGDSPTQFINKVSEAQKALKLSKARYNYYKFTGKIDSKTSGDTLKELVNERGMGIVAEGGNAPAFANFMAQKEQELYLYFEGKGLEGDELDAKVYAGMQQMFGTL